MASKQAELLRLFCHRDRHSWVGRARLANVATLDTPDMDPVSGDLKLLRITYVGIRYVALCQVVFPIHAHGRAQRCRLTARPTRTRVKRRSSFHHRSRAPVAADVRVLCAATAMCERT